MPSLFQSPWTYHLSLRAEVERAAAMRARDRSDLAPLNPVGPHPVCDYGFDAAHRLTQTAWCDWISHVAEASSRLELAQGARRPDPMGTFRGKLNAAISAVRRHIGAAVIRTGEHIRGAASPRPATDSPSNGASP